ncbi:MAG: hypothetical protein IKO57_04940 [Treponema sp.]|nr:hypothetical protein [Treponema sp.]
MGDSNETPVMPVDASANLDGVFSNDKFTVRYPASLKQKDVLGSDLFFEDDSGLVTISGTYNTEGTTLEYFKDFAENMVCAIKGAGMNPEAPVVKGKRYVIKATDEDNIAYNYCVMKADQIGIMGEFRFPKDEASDYEKYVGAFINSIEFK